MIYLRADAVTVEYDVINGNDAIVILAFPMTAHTNADSHGVAIVGDPGDMAGVAMTMMSLLDDIMDSDGSK